MNNKTTLYLNLFNLQANASKEDIKRRYRELAKEFHPDRNKDINANERFLIIKEAYEYLINYNSSFKNEFNHDKISVEKARYEKIRIAKERLNEYYKRKEIERKNYLSNFYNGIFWKSYKIMSFICLLYLIINFIDFITPKKQIKTIITDISQNYNSLTEEQIVLIKPKNGKEFFISCSIKGHLKFNDSINITESKILNKVYKVETRDNLEKSSFQTPNNSFIFFILFSLLLFIPTLFYIKTNRNIEDVFYTKIILSIYIPLILYLIISYFF